MKHLKKFNESAYIDGKLPTAEEFIKGLECYFVETMPFNTDTCVLKEDVKEKMIEFAKLHVKEALRVAAYSAEIVSCGNPYDNEDDSKCVDEKSILNSYPETNIK